MQSFPSCIQVNRVDERYQEERKRLQNLIRKEIYELILRNDERESFDLEKFSIFNTRRDVKLVFQLLSAIIIELKELGWKTQFCYGNTVLFIFANEKPSNCYDNGL